VNKIMKPTSKEWALWLVDIWTQLVSNHERTLKMIQWKF
jgi:hypothetical protein